MSRPRNRPRRVGLAVIVAAAFVSVGLTATGAQETRTQAVGAPLGPPTTAAAPELPGGGRSILPEHRVLAHYGAPQAKQLGILGIGTPASAGVRLRKHVGDYQGLVKKPVLPAMELIGVIASAGPGADGKYRYRQTRTVIRRYLTAARKAKAILILDIQPGRSDFVSEAKALEEFLREPDVGLALDPEWRMGPKQVPGKVIGSVDATEINALTRWLSGIVAARNLPDKLVIVHQFTEGMIRRKGGLKLRRGIDLVLNADGFGTPSAKAGTYGRVTRTRPKGSYTGFKLFYVEDTRLMSPSAVIRLRPSPLVVIYE